MQFTLYLIIISVHAWLSSVTESWYFKINQHLVEQLNSLEPRNLNEPTDIVGVDIMFHRPVRQLVPLIW